VYVRGWFGSRSELQAGGSDQVTTIQVTDQRIVVVHLLENVFFVCRFSMSFAVLTWIQQVDTEHFANSRLLALHLLANKIFHFMRTWRHSRTAIRKESEARLLMSFEIQLISTMSLELQLCRELPDKNFFVSKTLSWVDVHKRTSAVFPAILKIEGIHTISTTAPAFCQKITLDKTLQGDCSRLLLSLLLWMVTILCCTIIPYHHVAACILGFVVGMIVILAWRMRSICSKYAHEQYCFYENRLVPLDHTNRKEIRRFWVMVSGLTFGFEMHPCTITISIILFLPVSTILCFFFHMVTASGSTEWRRSWSRPAAQQSEGGAAAEPALAHSSVTAARASRGGATGFLSLSVIVPPRNLVRCSTWCAPAAKLNQIADRRASLRLGEHTKLLGSMQEPAASGLQVKWRLGCWTFDEADLPAALNATDSESRCAALQHGRCRSGSFGWMPRKHSPRCSHRLRP
jgi:hypothetical protein